MKKSARQFLDRVQGAVQVLRDTTSALEDRNSDAEPALRRVATAIAHAAKEFGLKEIERSALALRDAATHTEVLSEARSLASSLEGLAEKGKPEGYRILIVDDDRIEVTLLEALLDAPERDLVSAGTASEAREILRSQSFDLLILDLGLPDGDGRDLLLEIRGDQALEGMSVVICTGLPADQARAECLALGADDFLQKPVQADSVRAAAARQLGEIPPLRTSKILLVEDDRVTASLIQHRLKKEGFEVVHFANGTDAFETLKQERQLALAILDVKVPGMDGFELLQRFREIPHLTQVPVIMLTSMGQEGDIVRGLELGAEDYVLKPFSPVELMARVHRVLGT